MRAAWYVASRRDRRVHTGLWWGTEGKGPLRRPRRRGEDNIKINIQLMQWGVLYWINLDKDMDGWRALAIAVNQPPRFQKFRGIPALAEELLASQ